MTVKCGSQDLGTGTRTYMRAIVAEELGLQPEQVTEQIGRSNLGRANASGGSTTTASLAPAVKDAAFNAKRKFAERVRGDSRVRLKKLGLLTGDTYIDVSPGTPRFPAL